MTHEPAPRSAARAAFPRLAAVLLLGLAHLAVGGVLAGCGSGGGGGDPPSKPLANVCGDGQHISSVLGGFFGPAPWYQPANINSTNCPYPATVPVYSTCLTVTAVDRYDETSDGAVGTVYVQDTVSPTPIYAGTSLFDPGFTPPDLHVLAGNVLDVTGNYEEYIGPTGVIFPSCETLPQIEGSALFRFDGVVPDPVVVPIADLTTYDGARQYLNMLITVQNVSISVAPTSSNGRYSAPVAVPSGSAWTLSNQLFPMQTEAPLSESQTFTSVTGIWTYFESFSLAPRSCADLQGASPALNCSADGG